MIFSCQLLAALCLDFMFGDPTGYPHPVRIIGRMSVYFENLYRPRLRNLRIAGLLAFLSVLVSTLLPLAILLGWLAFFVPWVADTIAVLLLYTSVACRDLRLHSLRVHQALTGSSDLQQARLEVAKIVGRDTSELDRAGISRACVETVAENMVDGITAPIFYAVLVSILPSGELFTPLSLAALGAYGYKAVNTMDSMYGYKNERYFNFGYFAAKIDDLVNFLPARISGLILISAAFVLRLNYRDAARIFFRDRRQHASPNGGHPEAAVAGALGIQLGGNSMYFGKKVEKPTMGDKVRSITASDILATNRLMLMGSGLFVVLMLVVRLIVVGG